MKRLLNHVLAVGVFAASVGMIWSAPRQQTDIQKDKEQLQGTWQVVATKGFGKDVPAEELRTLSLTFKDDHIFAAYGDKSAEADYKLVLNQEGPSRIDFSVTKGPDAVKDKTLYGIYLLEGDTLKILYRNPGQQRPTSFMVEDEPGVFTVFLKRKRG
jgi:uncharacterized protein (TIGR03067 family)